MTQQEINWIFPPTSGGQETGFHDAGIETFGSRPLNSLAREVIQNSLDARKDETKPVHVAFEVRTVKDPESFGATQLLEHIDACLQESLSFVGGDQRREIQFFENAKNVLAKQVSFLRIYDEHTTGLRERAWDALVKQTGRSMKHRAGAGGSFGIGKHAPFAVSRLRTVFYWTCYEDGDSNVEKFQGKSILISHAHEYNGMSKKSQGVGFFGFTRECTPLNGEFIPDCFRVPKNISGETILGTALWIAGFSADKGWQFDIAQNVIANFFYAILKGELEITLELDVELGIDEEFFRINSSNLNDWLHLLKTYIYKNEGMSDNLRRVNETMSFLRLFEKDNFFSTEIAELGECKLWVMVDEQLPSKVGLIRGTGMLITTRQEGLQRFPKAKEFIAACVLNSNEANELLRGMENPEHNHFDVSRLLEEDRERGKRALSELKNWIREIVKECTQESIAHSVSNVDELACYLPDIDLPGSLNRSAKNNEKHSEEAFGIPGQILLVPPSYKPTPNVPSPTPRPPNPSPPGPNPVPNPNPVPAPNPVPPNPDPRPRKSELELKELRVVPWMDDPKKLKVLFSVDYTGIVQLELQQATDHLPDMRNDIKLIFTEPNTLSSCSVCSMMLCEFEIHSNFKIDNVAWILRAYIAN